MFVIRLPYFVVAIGFGSLVIFSLGKIVDLPIRPFEAIVIALTTIFVATVIYVLTFFTLGVFPPAKDE
jgi:Mn2+/Fe2+ NRAMP family transporter